VGEGGAQVEGSVAAQQLPQRGAARLVKSRLNKMNEMTSRL
jgi:hypothetical protein